MKLTIYFFITICLLLSFSNCCPNREPQSKKAFYLTLSLDNQAPYKNNLQTIFIESPNDDSGDVFVIGSRIRAKVKDSSKRYSNIQFYDITLRRLSGKNYGIVEIDEDISGDSTFKYILRISIDKLPNIPQNDEVTYKKSIPEIPQLSPNDQIEIQVTNLHQPGIGPKICQNQIGS